MACMAGPLVAVMLALVLAGCATVGDDPVPAACLGAPGTFVRALQRAPGAVRLAGGTRLSTCVSRARSDGDLQALGLSLTAAADTLRARVAADPAAAAGLGYLDAAVRAGVASNRGLATQLGRRIQHAATLDPAAPPAAQGARVRGLRAGESTG
jgi:hypothetical protein